MENLYLFFSSAGFYFLAPLTWVKSIQDGSTVDEELPLLSYSRGGDDSVRGVSRFRILLEHGELSFGMEADNVMGIETVEEKQMLLLGEPVINHRNRCLRAVVPMKPEQEQEILAFVLDLEYITEKEDLWNI